MAYSEDHIALAAEYALGTLDETERAQVETMIVEDKDFGTMVEAWEFKLGVLNQMVGSVEPPAELWNKIRTAVGLPESQTPVTSAAPLVSPLPAPPPPPLQTIAPAAAAETPVVEPVSNVVAFPATAPRWRNLAAITSAIAAALVAIVCLQVYQPDALPNGLRPKPRTQMVQVPAAPLPVPAQYVAVLQKDGGSPAFILSVDGATKNFTVRKVGASPEPGKSYELWLVSDKLQRPRSLGVIGSSDFTARPALASYDTDTVNKATYAVTVEPEGGSPTGVATGPIVFTGKLIEAVPPAAARSGR